MKGMDMLCASQAATSIRLFTEESGRTTTSTIYLGGNTSGRVLDRHNPIIRDATRITKVLLNTSTPCISSNPPPIAPKPKKLSRKENTNTNHQLKKKIVISSSKQNDNNNNNNYSSSTNTSNIKKKSCSSSWSCTKPSDFISPPGSSRYLLSSTTQKSSSFLSDHFDPLLELVPAGPHKHPTATNQYHVNNAKEKDDVIVVVADDCNGDNDSSSHNSNLPNSSSASSALSADQVVVLKVSLHCRGCERKMKKHLSKMEGVTSFTIDFAAKKVTVVGDVTPLSVVASVSKVKNAQLLTPPLASSVPSACSNLSEIKKDKGILV